MAAVLAGCDFAPKLPRVGFCRAVVAVGHCGVDLGACLAFLRCTVPEEQRAQLERALLILQAPAVGEHTATSRGPAARPSSGSARRRAT